MAMFCKVKNFEEGWQSLVECTGLENQQGVKAFGGSNPSPSATFLFHGI